VRAPYLHYLDLDRNQLTGTLPPTMFMTSSLNYVSLVRSGGGM